MAPFAQNAALEPLLRFAQMLGIAPEAVCDAIGIELHTATTSGHLMPSSTVMDAVEWIATASGMPHFGLLVSERIETRIIGLPALIAEQCRSVSDYNDVLRTHMPSHTSGFSLTLDHGDEGGVARLRILSRGRFASKQFTEAVLAIHARAFQKFLGPKWRPGKVLLAHCQLGKASDYARAFGTEIVYEAGQNAITFSAEDLRWHASGYDTGVRHHLEHLAAIDDHDIAGKVSAVIRTFLPMHQANIASVSSALATNERTLQRKLARSGTSFSELLSQTRLDLARDYLSRDGLSATEACSRLGFAELSILSRFLRKHLGASCRTLMKPQAGSTA